MTLREVEAIIKFVKYEKDKKLINDNIDDIVAEYILQDKEDFDIIFKTLNNMVFVNEYSSLTKSILNHMDKTRLEQEKEKYRQYMRFNLTDDEEEEIDKNINRIIRYIEEY